MANIKVIFKITFALQLLVFALATYGHPDAELIDFGSPTQPSRDQLIIEAAIKRGMDGEAVAELLRTRQPVVRTTTTPSGYNKTTTYKLEPDGSISSKSVMQKRHRYTYNSDDIPDDIKNNPTGTVTRTFTDNDGNKVTQTISVNHNTPVAGIDADDSSANWFNKPLDSSWPVVTPSSTTTLHRTRTFSSPNGERRTVQSWSSDPELTEPKTPFFSRRPNTRTYSNPDIYEPKFLPNGDTDWPNFDFSAFSQPWDNTDPDGLNDWEVVKDPEVTTRKNVESWTPKTWNWPKFPTYPTTTTTTARPNLFLEPESSNHKPLPNLDEFLKSQYGRPANREPTTTTSTVKSVATTTTKTSSSTPKVIKIEDLPVVEVLHNGKPADENILKTLPAHLTPRTPPEHVLSVEHKRPISDSEGDIYTPKVDATNVRTFSKTHIGPEKPKLSDLDPQMQDILRNAGIIPEIEGDSITKTRTEPDGRVITTTYKVNTVNTPDTVQHYGPSEVATHSFSSYNGDVPLFGVVPNFSPISEFLSKLGLTKVDLTTKSGRYTKTLIDPNGEVLTATFVLTPPKARPFK